MAGGTKRIKIWTLEQHVLDHYIEKNYRSKQLSLRVFKRAGMCQEKEQLFWKRTAGNLYPVRSKGFRSFDFVNRHLWERSPRGPRLKSYVGTNHQMFIPTGNRFSCQHSLNKSFLSTRAEISVWKGKYLLFVTVL
ncbi:hypothetical protein TNIN_188911 [Trichonephila inaurata madagascariensis]|uniref:Uncharacterized protein n=1 Tax=Trichonephila inaurata madagascariensis TaxID=2747483 RepID=A0A8X6XLF6_9ARAC|nr:hypothetical protein TNIN_188911 [Trichonephila inaurata madagascariensis]